MVTTDFPILTGSTVTDRHRRICESNGHGFYILDGVSTGICPRCGDNTDGEVSW